MHSPSFTVRIARHLGKRGAASAGASHRSGSEIATDALGPLPKPRRLEPLLGAVVIGCALSMAIAPAALFAQPAVPMPPAAALSPEASAAAYQDGKDLLYSSKTVTDKTRQGLALLETAAANGNVPAQLELGGVYLYGTLLPKDLPRARGYFDSAAAAGDWSGLAQYGMMQMWDQTDWRSGQALLESAGEKGVGSAWLTLAQGASYGYLGGGKASRAKYQAYADKARAAGEEGLALLEAERLQWGISQRADGRKALDGLHKAAESGNRAAAKQLITLLRDGNKYNIHPDPAAAKTALQTFGALLNGTETWQFERSLQAASAKGAQDYAALAAAIAAQKDQVNGNFGEMLLKANPNALVYVLQTRLAAAGHDIGKPDGFAGRKTINALHAACLQNLSAAGCADSMLPPEVMAAVLSM